MQPPAESLVARFLYRLAHYVYAYPRLFFYPQVLLVVLATFYTVSELQFSTSRSDLVGSDKKYHQNFLAFRREFGAQDDLVAVVESEDREKNRQFVERLGAKLEAEPEIFADVVYKGDLNMLGRKALLFFPEDTLNELLQTLGEYRPFVEQFAQSTNLNSLFRMVNSRFRKASREVDPQTESMIRAIPALRRIIEQATDSMSRPGTPPSPGITALFNAGDEAEQQQYITFANGQIYLVTARAPNEELNATAVERLRTLVRKTEGEVPGVNAGITGEPVLEHDEMVQSQKDSMFASVIALLVVALIFIYAYSETGRPIKATIALVAGLAYTMGFTTLVIGHLNILTITFLPILIGLAIDFGVHLITRYEEELRHGKSELEALEKAMVNTGMGIFTGCLTTAGAFFAMGLTDFKGIQEMGVITGGGMVICLIPMLTFLPVLLLRGRQNVMDHQRRTKPDRRAEIERLWLERPVPIILTAAVLCLIAWTQFRKVRFDYNLLNMQSEGLPAVVFEHNLIQSASKSVLFAAVMADSLDEAVSLEHKLTNLPGVASVESMSRYLAEDPARKLALIKRIKDAVEEIEFPEVERGTASVAELSQTLLYTQGYLGLAVTDVRKEGEKQIERELRALRQAIGDLRQRISLQKAPDQAAKLGAFEYALFQDIAQTFETLKNQDHTSGFHVDDLPPAMRNRFVGRTGKHLLQVYPREDVWERAHQEVFVRELRTVDPNVTGTPVQLLEYTTLLKQSYERAAFYALAAIALLVFIHFIIQSRSLLVALACVILALLPVAVGSIWLGGIMGALNVPFNPANIMTLPLVIGIGITSGIHILNRFAEEQNPGILAKSTGKAVLISALTTMAGFASLIPAKHQGIASLGLVMSVGVATCMIAALTFLPAVLNLMARRGWAIKKPSGNNAQLTLGREEPR